MTVLTVGFPDGSTLPVEITYKTGATPPTNPMVVHTVILGREKATEVELTLTPGSVVSPPPPAPPTPVPNAPVTVGALTFNETFDGPLDLSVWALNYFGETGVNGVTCDPANVAVENGSCSLTLSSPTVGACITTNPAGGPSVGFQFGYGFVEYRAWFPNNGVFSDWAAVWTSSQDWPSTGEIDIAESLQGNLTSNYHSVNGANNMAISGNWTGWTTFGVNRRVGVNDVYWGGRLVRSYQTFDDGAPHYLIANVGNGQDNPLVVGAALKLSYVRYWLPV